MVPPCVSRSLVLLAGLCCLASWPQAECRQKKRNSSRSNDELQAHLTCHRLSSIITNLAFAMYAEPARWSNSSNVLFSPVSIAAALAMLSLGTQGDTQSQIRAAMKFSLKETTGTQVHRCFQQLLGRLLQQGKARLQVLTGSSLFMAKGVKPVATFLTGIKNWYHSKATAIDFQDTKEARKRIREQIEQDTKKKTLDVAQEFDKSTRLILVNYFSLQGKWFQDGQEALPVQEDFYVEEKKAVLVPMLSRVGTFYLQRDKFLSSWVLVQPGGQGDTAVFILPDPRKMRHLEKGLTHEHFEDLPRHVGARPARVYFPKLSISGTYNLKPIMGKLGITKVFSNEADFSGITKAPLKLSQAVHRAVLTMDERFKNVTKASAQSSKSNLTVKFNRPFLFILKNTNMHFPLLMGKVVNPTQP
ncbi:alpha-1-antitrypsin-related protein [Ochotona princeps]|uniref:alpha-1-antitrypsin-related protein n=1 Tax=Ochotona princeps TaxID=9978 RepID=UPI0027153750|nr:alpha-1-antitrypsin-related protein [Ochotona princeps]